MANLKVPSLQHLARLWRSEPKRIQKTLVQLVNSSPTFNYNPLFGAVRDMLVLNVSYDQIVEGIVRGEKRPNVQGNFLEILPLIRDHFDGLSPDFVHRVGKRYYPVGRGLMVPFEPPLVYGIGGQLYFPWFSFWKFEPLAAERLSLFVTLIDEILLQDPDLEEAKFEILDFSAPKPKTPRELVVSNAEDIPRLNEKTKIEMLEIFGEGYFLAADELSRSGKRTQKDDKPSPPPDPNQRDLFG